MQKSLQSQLVVFLALLFICSQAFPILDSSSDSNKNTARDVLLDRGDDARGRPPHGAKEHGDDDIVPLYGLYKRSLSTTIRQHEPSHEQLAHDVQYLHQPPSIPHFRNPSSANTLTFPFQATNPSAQAAAPPSSHAAAGPKSTRTHQTNANSYFRFSSASQTAPNELLQAGGRHRLFGERERPFALSKPFRAPQASSPRTPSQRPSISIIHNLYATTIRHPLADLAHEQHHGNGRDTLASQSHNGWFSLPFRGHHAASIAEHQRSPSEPNFVRYAGELAGWKSSSTIPKFGAPGQPIPQREPVLGQSVFRQAAHRQPTSIFGGQPREQRVLGAAFPHSRVLGQSTQEPRRPYLGLSWTRENAFFAAMRDFIFGKTLDRLVPYFRRPLPHIPSSKAPTWTHAHSILAFQERKVHALEAAKHIHHPVPKIPFFAGLKMLLEKHALRPGSAYRLPQKAHTITHTSNGGTIHMASPSLTHSHPIPVVFKLTTQTCSPLALECSCITKDLASRIIKEYPAGISSSTNSITETVGMKMRGKEYRVTLDIKLNREIDGQGLQDLLGLLVSVKQELAKAKNREGFGTVNVHGSFNNIEFEAVWTYYQVTHGIPQRCA